MIKLRAKNKNIVDFVCRRRPNLLSLEEAWNVPISAEMTSRQQQQQQQLKQKQKMPHKSNSQKHSLVSCRGLFLYLTQTRFQKRYVKKKTNENRQKWANKMNYIPPIQVHRYDFYPPRYCPCTGLWRAAYFMYLFWNGVELIHEISLRWLGQICWAPLKWCLKFTPQDLQHLNGHNNNNTAAVPVTSTASATALAISAKRFKVNWKFMKSTIDQLPLSFPENWKLWTHQGGGLQRITIFTRVNIFCFCSAW